MLRKELILPFYLKITLILLGFFVFISILYTGQSIIIPLIFSIIIAVLLNQAVNFLVNHKINRIVAIIISMALAFILIAASVLLLWSQATQLTESWPAIVEKFTSLLDLSINRTAGYFDIDETKIHEWIAQTKTDLLNNNSVAIGETLISVGGSLIILLLIPVYIFVILYYKPMLMEFFHQLLKNQNQNQIKAIFTQTKGVIQRYLIGLVIETLIVAAMESTALFILGIQFAILLGVLGALLNLIPYIGGLVAVAIPMLIALGTKDSAWYAIYILIIYYIIQLIDNNYIVPIIVASKVKINALFSIIAVVAGNQLWGISGMFLAIPMLAIVKLICDNIDSLKPWGLLLGGNNFQKIDLIILSKK